MQTALHPSIDRYAPFRGLRSFSYWPSPVTVKVPPHPCRASVVASIYKASKKCLESIGPSRSWFYRNNSVGEQVMRCASILATVVMLAGCSGGPVFEPEVTSYPRNRVVQENVKMWVAPSILRTSKYAVLPKDDGTAYAQGRKQAYRTVTYDFTQTTVGDSAMKEVWVIPGRGVGSSERALLSALPARARGECGSDFRPVRTRYFLGDEATVSMLGIQGRSLKGLVRCSVYRGAPKVPGEAALRRFGRSVPDLSFFDASSTVFPAPNEAVQQAVRRYVSKQRLAIRNSRKSGGTSFIHTSHPPRAFSSRGQDLISITQVSGGTRVTLIAARYRDYIHSYSVFSSTPDKTLGLAPMDRDVAYRNTQKTFGAIAEELGVKLASEQ